MQIIYKDIKVNYVFYDNKSDVNLVYLHGWGQNIEMMEPISKPFMNSSNVLILDLPGFGKSEEPKEVWGINDYADLVNHLVRLHNMSSPILIGHSFGGKVALMYATMYEARKLVLFASPYKKHSNDNSMKVKVLKGLKKVPVVNKLEGFAKRHMGSTDYKNATEMMRSILVKHVNLDLTEEVKKIKCPTLIVWGTEDAAVPYNDGVELSELIRDAGLVTYEGCTHYAYLERLNQTINVLKSFIGGK